MCATQPRSVIHEGAGPVKSFVAGDFGVLTGCWCGDGRVGVGLRGKIRPRGPEVLRGGAGRALVVVVAVFTVVPGLSVPEGRPGLGCRSSIRPPGWGHGDLRP